MALKVACLSALAAHAFSVDNFLQVSGTGFSYGGQQIFLNGVNQAWLNYGSDFGNNQSNGVYCTLKDDYLKQVQAAGGNSVRFWLFVEGETIPAFGTDGKVVATDKAGSLIEDVRKYVQTAASMNILVFFTLWNGANANEPRSAYWNMIREDSGDALQSFIDNALTPLVTALKNEPGIGGWEVINEPEGSVVAGVQDTEGCFDTMPLKGQGPGWTHTQIPMKNMQRFVNWQAAAIHAADPKALVTVGSWNPKANEDMNGFQNYWKDECLLKAGGKKTGTLDFYQIHSYPYNGHFDDQSPFTGNRSKTAYKLSKPLVIGEFPSDDNNGGFTDPQLYKYSYDHGFDGAWGWAASSDHGPTGFKNLSPGMKALKGQAGISITVGGQVPPDTCSCSDVAPDTTYTCAQQASWGKCGQSFMKGHCCRSCFACQGCNGDMQMV